MIRLVKVSDTAEWLRMRMELWPDSDSNDETGEIAQYFAGLPLPTLHVAYVYSRPDGGLCGLVEASIHHSAPGCQTDRIGYIEAWFVDPDWRSKGVGRALVEQVETWAREQGCTEMASDTTPFYPLSPQAHGALGYEEVERYFRKDL
jgi:aminoglycoside 6'-N-acetyltransferase I